MKKQYAKKVEIIEDFRGIIQSQNSELITIQAKVLNDYSKHDIFDMLNKVVKENFALWDALYTLEGKTR